MSSDARLKRLGLDHLKDDPKRLKEVLGKAVTENRRAELEATLRQLQALLESMPTDLEKRTLQPKIEAVQRELEALPTAS